MSYVIRRELSPNRAAIVFEFDPQSEGELYQDFPWLRQIGVFGFRCHPLSNSERGEEYLPITRHNRQPLPNVAPNRLWSWLTGLFSPRFSPYY